VRLNDYCPKFTDLLFLASKISLSLDCPFKMPDQWLRFMNAKVTLVLAE